MLIGVLMWAMNQNHLDHQSNHHACHQHKQLLTMRRGVRHPSLHHHVVVESGSSRYIILSARFREKLELQLIILRFNEPPRVRVASIFRLPGIDCMCVCARTSVNYFYFTRKPGCLVAILPFQKTSNEAFRMLRPLPV